MRKNFFAIGMTAGVSLCVAGLVAHEINKTQRHEKCTAWRDKVAAEPLREVMEKIKCVRPGSVKYSNFGQKHEATTSGSYTLGGGRPEDSAFVIRFTVKPGLNAEVSARILKDDDGLECEEGYKTATEEKSICPD